MERYSHELDHIYFFVHSRTELDSVRLTNSSSNRHSLLPWGTQSRSCIAATSGIIDMQTSADGTLRPGEIVMRTLFADFTQQAEKKIEGVMLELTVSTTERAEHIHKQLSCPFLSYVG